MNTASTNKIGLSLSGGGYRATLFNLGALWRLNELGILSKLSVVSSVSGGSIISAHLALEWKNLTFDGGGIATNFESIVARPIQQFCSKGIDFKAGVKGFFSPISRTGTELQNEYKKSLFGEKTLADLPNQKVGEGPKFVILSTNYHTGSAFRFIHNGFADYRLGDYSAPDIAVATAVAASSAFPPIFSPIQLKLDSDRWTNTPKKIHVPKRLLKGPMLVDGGVYDNLGLQQIRDHVDYALVSDAGKPFDRFKKQKRNWFSQLGRVRDIGMNQALARRKSELIRAFKRDELNGTYWGINTDIDLYGPDPIFYQMSDKSVKQAEIRTRLDAFSEAEQRGLINWAYALTDAAIRKHTPDLVSSSIAPTWPRTPSEL